MTSLENDLRALLLSTILAQTPRDAISASLQSGSVLDACARACSARRKGLEEALLTQFYELFRTGHSAWGVNLSNPDPPFFHITDRGTAALAHHNRDPSNPAGYFAHLSAITRLNPIAVSYLKEAVDCYCAGLSKAAAVWPALVHQIRVVRNDAGHPSSVEPVTDETAHAQLLVFPELAKITAALAQHFSNPQ